MALPSACPMAPCGLPTVGEWACWIPALRGLGPSVASVSGTWQQAGALHWCFLFSIVPSELPGPSIWGSRHTPRVSVSSCWSPCPRILQVTPGKCPGLEATLAHSGGVGCVCGVWPSPPGTCACLRGVRLATRDTASDSPGPPSRDGEQCWVLSAQGTPHSRRSASRLIFLHDDFTGRLQVQL